ncbi:MAG: hypothetical protein V3U76_18925 [Granulosicoccus sp.]
MSRLRSPRPPTWPDTADSDCDKVDDAEDNCPVVSNPDQENLDYDQHGDVCDDDIDGQKPCVRTESDYSLV